MFELVPWIFTADPITICFPIQIFRIHICTNIIDKLRLIRFNHGYYVYNSKTHRTYRLLIKLIIQNRHCPKAVFAYGKVNYSMRINWWPNSYLWTSYYLYLKLKLYNRINLIKRKLSKSDFLLMFAVDFR